MCRGVGRQSVHNNTAGPKDEKVIRKRKINTMGSLIIHTVNPIPLWQLKGVG
jgi:hypothetical protein